MYEKHVRKTQFVIKRIDDGAWIPADEANTDYQRYLEWVAAGGIPEVIEA